MKISLVQGFPISKVSPRTVLRLPFLQVSVDIDLCILAYHAL